MAFQRVDKKNLKVVNYEELEGFSYKDIDGNKATLELVDDAFLEIRDNIDGFSNSCFIVDTNDIPKLVKALWASYALAEDRKMQGNL